MKFIEKLRFQTRINIAFGLLLLTLLIGGVGIVRMDNTNKVVEEFYNHPYVVKNAAGNMQFQVSNLNHWLDHCIHEKNVLNQDFFLNELKKNDSLLVSSIEIISKQYLGNELEVENIKQSYKDYSKFIKQVLEFKKQGDISKAETLLEKEGLLKMNHLLSQVEVVLEFANQKTNELFTQNLDYRDNKVKFFWMIILVLVILNFLLAFIISKSITRPIAKVIIDLKNLYGKSHDEDLEKHKHESEQQILSNTVLELKKAYSKLNNFNEELENKVYERTLEMNKNKEKLLELNKDLIKANKNIEIGKNYLDNILNNIGHPVFVKDVNSCLLDVNQAFCDIFKLSKDKIIGRTLSEEVSPQEVDEFLKIDKEVLRTGKQSITEETLTLLGDEARPIIATKTRYIDENGKKYLIGVITDISEQKVTEQKLIESKERAEKSEALKSAFLANMSHEIRTPMNAILGFTSLLKDKKIDQKQKSKFLRLIEDAGNRLLIIISDIVDVSKLNSNQLKIINNTHNLNEIIDNLHAQFSLQIQKKDVTLKFSKGLTDNDSFIKTDKIRLMQVLSNLIENALKFTKQGSVSFGYTIEDAKIKFYVEDTGIGINPKDQKLIFDRFSQVENDYSKEASGTGLGLAIAKGIVDLFKGEIYLESTIKKGTTFYFTIPYVQEQPNKTYVSMVQKEKPLLEKKGTTILVAEDEITNFIYIREVLKKFDFTIIHAENGKEALRYFKENKDIDLVLMDIKMPIMDGYETTLAIREISSTVPIIAITAYAMAEDESQALAAGCNEYISKPASKQKLYDLIFQYLNIE